MTYSFTDNPTELTDAIAGDTLNSCLMYLKKDYCPRNHIDGLILSNETDADHDIKIAAGECSDSTNSTKILNSTAITKQIDANWAEGDDSGGFPSALTLAADTWYHLFAIMKDDYTVDAGFDTSLTATNLLADATSYTYYRRIGSVLTDASSNIIGFKQVGDKFILNDITQDISTSPATTATLHALTVPIGLSVMADVTIFCRKSSTGSNYGLITSPYQSDNVPTVSLSNAYCSVDVGDWRDDGCFNFNIITNNSKQIRSRFTSTDGTIEIYTNGWTDLRGKE
jgi:hypothetical protein